MSAPSARRRSTPPAAGSTALSYQLILEHILTYPGPYPLRQDPKMPLRSNSTRSRPQMPKQWSSSRLTPPSVNMSSPTPSPTLIAAPETPSPDVTAAATFTSSLLNRLGNSSSQPCSLPPIFTASFLRNCFPLELHLVDFPQALEGLEYLEDLNRRRRREVAGARRRLGLRDGAVTEGAEGGKLSEAVKVWVRDVENSERKAEALFTQLFVALRRWILINELSLIPFNKHNALAMLNTLYPPSRCTSATNTTGPTSATSNPQIPTTATSASSQPSTTLTPSVLSNQRTAFLTYITAVESRGPAVLKPLMNQGMRPGDSEWETGWPAVAATMNMYLRICLKAIEDAAAVKARDDLELPVLNAGSASAEKEKEKKAKCKVDSAISGAVGAGAGTASRSPATPITPSTGTAGTETDRFTTSKSASSIKPTARTSAQSNTSATSTPADRNKPLPPSPPHGAAPPTTTPASALATAMAPRQQVAPSTISRGHTKPLTRLEKIALEVRRIRAKRSEEPSHSHVPSPPTHIDLTSTSTDDDKENTQTSAAAARGRGRCGQGELDDGDGDMVMSGALASNTASAPEKYHTQSQPQTQTQTQTRTQTQDRVQASNDDGRGRPPPPANPASTSSSAMKRFRSLGDMKVSQQTKHGTGKSRSRSRATAAVDHGHAVAGNNGDAEVFDETEMRRQRALFDSRGGGTQ